MVRASLGAMSTRDDISKFVSFLQKTFVSQGSTRALLSEHDRRLESAPEYVEDMDYDIGSPALATAGTGA